VRSNGTRMEEFCTLKDRRGLSLFKHDFRGFDDGTDGIADLKFHFIGTAASDDALNDLVAHMNDDMGHDIAKVDFCNFTDQAVAG
jgi:hypothetical protein